MPVRQRVLDLARTLAANNSPTFPVNVPLASRLIQKVAVGTAGNGPPVKSFGEDRRGLIVLTRTEPAESDPDSETI
jgi:hypothetical protein